MVPKKQINKKIKLEEDEVKPGKIQEENTSNIEKKAEDIISLDKTAFGDYQSEDSDEDFNLSNEVIPDSVIEEIDITIEKTIPKTKCIHCGTIQDRPSKGDTSTTWCINCQRAFLTDGDKNNVVRNDRWTQC
jgi:hypothetical protein